MAETDIDSSKHNILAWLDLSVAIYGKRNTSEAEHEHSLQNYQSFVNNQS